MTEWHGENITYGKENALDAVLALIIDDNVKSRGHRTNIFNPNFTVCGVCSGAHPVYKSMIVMDFATMYEGNGEKPPVLVRPNVPK